MIITNLELLNESFLKQACENQYPESLTLDFKKELPGKEDKAKSDFLKDVCAFANTSGGDLAFGVNESRSDAPHEIIPISPAAKDADLRRLGQMLDAGIEPRLIGYRFFPVDVDGGYVLVLRIPQSFNGPHRYRVNENTKFVFRNMTHITEMSYDQLRSAFDRTATLVERARQFRSQRLQAVMNQQTWKPMPNGPICVVQLIPLTSMTPQGGIDLQQLQSNHGQFALNDWGGSSSRWNLDGLVVYPGGYTQGTPTYTQIFRSGLYEGLRTARALWETEDKSIYAYHIDDFIRSTLISFVKAAQSCNQSGPAIMAVALLNVGEYQFNVGSRFFGRDSNYSDRPHLILPETWVDDLGVVNSIDDFVRPMLNMIWQGFGKHRCLDYDDSGAWNPKQ